MRFDFYLYELKISLKSKDKFDEKNIFLKFLLITLSYIYALMI